VIEVEQKFLGNYLFLFSKINNKIDLKPIYTFFFFSYIANSYKSVYANDYIEVENLLVTKNQELNTENVINDCSINISEDNTKNISIKTAQEQTSIKIEYCDESSQNLYSCNNLDTDNDDTLNNTLINISAQVCI